MNNNHSHYVCSQGARSLCEALFTKLEYSIPGLRRSESQQWCGLFQAGKSRFAYISHQKAGVAITVWCMGKPDELIDAANGSQLEIRPRSGSKGGWDKTFKCRFTLQDTSVLNAAADILFNVSYAKTLDREAAPTSTVIHRLHPLAEEVTEVQEFPEGVATKVLINSYERNPKARAKCIEIHGTRCSVCGFDFEAVYGEVGAGYIHVHHLIPLSTITTEYRVNPKEDLLPVCPNCHAIIHKKTPPFTIEEVKNLLKKH